MLKSLDKQLLCELLLNNVFCLAFSSNFCILVYLGLCIRYLCISGYFAGPWRWTFKYIFIIWNLEFSTHSTYVYNTMIIYTVRTTCLHVHSCCANKYAVSYLICFLKAHTFMFMSLYNNEYPLWIIDWSQHLITWLEYIWTIVHHRFLSLERMYILLLIHITI